MYNTGKEFLEEMVSLDGNMFEFNPGTQKLVDNLDKGISTFIRLPRQNRQSLTCLGYGLYKLLSTGKSIVIYSKDREFARMNRERILDLYETNNPLSGLKLKKKIVCNPTKDQLEKLINNDNIAMIIYDEVTLDQLNEAIFIPNILTTISSIYYDTSSIEEVLKQNSIDYVEFSYKELGLSKEWFERMCKVLMNSYYTIKRELLLDFKDDEEVGDE